MEKEVRLEGRSVPPKLRNELWSSRPVRSKRISAASLDCASALTGLQEQDSDYRSVKGDPRRVQPVLNSDQTGEVGRE